MILELYQAIYFLWIKDPKIIPGNIIEYTFLRHMTDDDQIISTKLSHVSGFCPDDDQIISIKESICHQWVQWLPPHPHPDMCVRKRGCPGAYGERPWVLQCPFCRSQAAWDEHI